MAFTTSCNQEFTGINNIGPFNGWTEYHNWCWTLDTNDRGDDGEDDEDEDVDADADADADGANSSGPNSHN